MRVLNIMLGKGKGGLEQASFDYADMLTFQGHSCLTIASKKSWLLKSLDGAELKYLSLRQWGVWDWFAARQLRKIAEDFRPDLITLHGNRAAGLARKAFSRLSIPLIAIAHNYRFKGLLPADHVFAVAPDIARSLSEQSLQDDNIQKDPDWITIVPNTVRMKDLPRKSQLIRTHPPLIIGVLGRLSKEKGVDIFLEALSHLSQEKIPFQAIIGGDGPEKDALIQKAQALNLQNHVQFMGWIKDKTAFFEKIDIFCLPSRIESFGIALLEAFAAGKPVVSSNTSGPLSIAKHNYNALFFEKERADEMAKMFGILLRSPDKRYQLAEQGYHTARQSYDFPIVSAILEQALTSLLPPRSLFARIDKTDEMNDISEENHFSPFHP
jgi:glycosyltransferase involved in cell wall biosynthesis